MDYYISAQFSLNDASLSSKDKNDSNQINTLLENNVVRHITIVFKMSKSSIDIIYTDLLMLDTLIPHNLKGKID